MPSTIWTQCGPRFKFRTRTLHPWRVVEGQNEFSTRKLADSAENHERLEELLDESKPPMREDIASLKLNFLFKTPFRYPPQRHGSRFDTHWGGGLLYASDSVETALSEAAYYRFLFLHHSLGNFKKDAVLFTVFNFSIKSKKFADLTQSPFLNYRQQISDPASYVDSQPLGFEIREKGAEGLSFFSARDSNNGVNYGIFNPRIVMTPNPIAWESWICFADKNDLEFHRQSPAASSSPRSFSFRECNFHVNGRFPVIR